MPSVGHVESVESVESLQNSHNCCHTRTAAFPHRRASGSSRVSTWPGGSPGACPCPCLISSKVLVWPPRQTKRPSPGQVGTCPISKMLESSRVMCAEKNLIKIGAAFWRWPKQSRQCLDLCCCLVGLQLGSCCHARVAHTQRRIFVQLAQKFAVTWHGASLGLLSVWHCLGLDSASEIALDRFQGHEVLSIRDALHETQETQETQECWVCCPSCLFSSSLEDWVACTHAQSIRWHLVNLWFWSPRAQLHTSQRCLFAILRVLPKSSTMLLEAPDPNIWVNLTLFIRKNPVKPRFKVHQFHKKLVENHHRQKQDPLKQNTDVNLLLLMAETSVFSRDGKMSNTKSKTCNKNHH